MLQNENEAGDLTLVSSRESDLNLVSNCAQICTRRELLHIHFTAPHDRKSLICAVFTSYELHKHLRQTLHVLNAIFYHFLNTKTICITKLNDLLNETQYLFCFLICRSWFQKQCLLCLSTSHILVFSLTSRKNTTNTPFLSESEPTIR